MDGENKMSESYIDFWKKTILDTAWVYYNSLDTKRKDFAKLLDDFEKNIRIGIEKENASQAN